MKTELKIFDVRHGFCAALIRDGKLILIDCGHDAGNVRPLQWLYDRGFRHIETLVVSNFDQDHISDIVAIRDNFTVGSLALNPSVNPETLRNIKAKGGDISKQMNILINTMAETVGAISQIPKGLDDVNMYFYHVLYPYEIDTNNLSLVTFLQFGTSYIIYPGDIEKSAWLRFLENPAFVEKLEKVNVFIASHHGRINGYCEEVFNYCSPEVVVISDQELNFSTQEHDRYAKHALGLNMGTAANPDIRKVLTTRNDGHLTLHTLGNDTYLRKGL